MNCACVSNDCGITDSWNYGILERYLPLLYHSNIPQMCLHQQLVPGLIPALPTTVRLCFPLK